MTESKQTKIRGIRSDDAEIVAQSDIIKLMAHQGQRLLEILDSLPDAATRDRVTFWMDQRFGRAARVETESAK